MIIGRPRVIHTLSFFSASIWNILVVFLAVKGIYGLA